MVLGKRQIDNQYRIIAKLEAKVTTRQQLSIC
jgi:hypothetical protein